MPPLKVSFRGFFTVDLIDAKSGLIKRHLEFENLITDAGLNALGTGTSIGTLINGFMGCGTNATAPAVSDTTLGAEIAPTATHRSNSVGGIGDVVASGPAFAYWSRKITRLFVEAQANGNLTELGMFQTSGASTMWCRQLFKDGAGVPTVIVKTVADQLRVTYEVRVYIPADATISPLVISGANYDVTTRAIDINDDYVWGANFVGSQGGMLVHFSGNSMVAGGINYCLTVDNDVLVSPTGTLAGASAACSSIVGSGYVSGNFWRDITTIWEPAVGNHAGGIGSLVSCLALPNGTPNLGSMHFQQKFAPKMPKDNTKRFTFVNRLSWGRYP